MPLKPSLFALSVLVIADAASGAVLSPTALTFSSPAGTNNPATGAAVDDVYLETLSFGPATFSAASGQFAAARSFHVSSGRPLLFAERGDEDDASDGDPDPYTRVGLNLADFGSTDPGFQDRSLASASSTLSLTEGIDANNGSSTFHTIFTSGVSDNNAAADSVPEIILFERGNNDDSSVRAIIGGSWDNPIYAPNTVVLSSGSLWNTGLFINTLEIGSQQQLSAIGIDASDFGTAATIWGVEITTDGGDFFGQFASAEDTTIQFDSNVPAALLNPDGVVPEPGSLWLSLIGLATLFRRRTGVNS